MVVLTNNWSTESLEEECTSLDIKRLHFDRGILDGQKKELQEVIKRVNKTGKSTAKRIIAEIDKLEKKLDDDDCIEYCWQFKDECMKSYPVTFVEEDSIGIKASDAIVVNQECKVVTVEMPTLLDLIAFEYGRKQIGYDTTELEEALSDIGITGIHSTTELSDRIDSFNGCYREIAKLVVTDSEYCDNNGNIQGYFNKTKYGLCSESRYGYVIAKTCKIVSSIVALSIAGQLKRVDRGAALISVGKSKIVLMTSMDTDVEKLLDSFIIKIAGRQFALDTLVEETE